MSSELAAPLDRLASRPVTAAVLAALVISFTGVLVRLADVEPATAAVFRCVYALPVLWFLARSEERRFGPRAPGQRRLAVIAGLFFAADLVAWHYAIAMVGAGLATVLGNTQVVFVAVAAWLFFGERLTARLVVALIVALGGVVLISGVVGGEAYGENPVAGVVLGLFTGAAYAGFLLVQRRGNRDPRRPAGPLLDATASAALASAAAGVVLGEISFLPTWPSAGWLVILALSAQVVGYLLISVALPRLPSAVTSIVLLIQPVAAVGLAMLILGESPSPTQLLGVGLVVGGVLLATARAPRGRQASGAEAVEGP
ncbi:MAG TPA: DMT family transporter [Candidatus Limnocylindria bacterium]|nr:DMT family transporter [Candidatus Limnocylindria bacterium]